MMTIECSDDIYVILIHEFIEFDFTLPAFSNGTKWKPKKTYE